MSVFYYYLKKGPFEPSQGFLILHFSGRGAPTFVFHFYKTRGFSNTKVGARKPPYFCLRALRVRILSKPLYINI